MDQSGSFLLVAFSLYIVLERILTTKREGERERQNGKKLQAFLPLEEQSTKKKKHTSRPFSAFLFFLSCFQHYPYGSSNRK